MTDLARYTAQNRAAWNRVAESRRSLLSPPLFFAEGGVTLEPAEIQAMGPVRGKRLLHLQCASGNDTLSWAVLGADVTGVDISDVAVAIAAEQALAAGLDVRFHAADVYDLPPHLRAGGFDAVYTGGGAVCWLPDLAVWADVVAGCLRSGGVALVCDHHPVWETVAVTGSGVVVTADYFGRGTPRGEPMHPVNAPSGAGMQDDYVSFVWPLGDVVTALAGAGLRIELVAEQSEPAIFLKSSGASEEMRRAASRLPAWYALRARKP